MSGGLALTGWVLALVATAATALAGVALLSRAHAVARASHELRGPLTAVRLGMELGLRSGVLAPERIRAVMLELDRATLALGDLSAHRGRRIRARAMLTSAEPVDVADLLADSVEAWRPFAFAAGSELRVSFRDEPAIVVGDRARLAQATGNLIANAVEHGGGAIEVGASAGDGRVRIEVRDEGPGLRAPLAELSAGRRWRGSRKRGHGLAVTRAVAVAHGGRLAAAPSDLGARLVLELPALDRRRAAPPPALDRR